METVKKGKYQKILAPIVIGAFFCFLCIYYGVGEYPDSVTYLNGSIEREPFYPLLLRGMHFLFGDGYLYALIWLQNLIAFLVTWYLYHGINRHMKLNLLLQWGLLAVLLMPHLMSGVFTSSGIILTNAVLSEGITLSLYQLFFMLLYNLWAERKLRYAVLSMLTAFIATLARGQMLPLLLVWMAVMLATLIRIRPKWQKGLAAAVLIVAVTVLAFGMRSVLIRQYNQSMYGVSIGNTGGSMTILTNVLYSMDEEAVAEVAGVLPEEEGTLLSESYEKMKAQGYVASDSIGADYEIAEPESAGAQSADPEGTDFQSGIIARIRHHEDCHDRIKFEILYPELESYVREHMAGLSPEEIRYQMDVQAGKYTALLLKEDMGAFLKTYLYVICGGFIRTVSVLSPVFAIYAMVIYIVAIGLMWYVFKRKKNAGAAGMMALVLLMIAANVCATGLTIMCLSRYMIYNTAIFYAAGIVLLQAAFRKIQ